MNMNNMNNINSNTYKICGKCPNNLFGINSTFTSNTSSSYCSLSCPSNSYAHP